MTAPMLQGDGEYPSETPELIYLNIQELESKRQLIGRDATLL